MAFGLVGRMNWPLSGGKRRWVGARADSAGLRAALQETAKQTTPTEFPFTDGSIRRVLERREGHPQLALSSGK